MLSPSPLLYRAYIPLNSYPLRITILTQELYFLARSYSLPGTVLPKKEVKIGKYAVACFGPGTVLTSNKKLRE